MCNNIRINKISVKKVEEKKKDQISDWLEERPVLSRNVLAKKRRVKNKNSIKYISGAPLKLHDGTRIYKIISQKIDDKYAEIIINFSFKGKQKVENVSFKRFVNDNLLDIEKFLENSQSIFQTRNIDLNYK